MFDQLERYLLSVIPYEKTDMFLANCKVLLDCNLKTFESDIEEILLTLDNYDSVTNVTSIESVLTNYSVSTLKQFMIDVVNDTPMDVLSAVIKTLLILPNYGDKEHILTLLNSENNPEETLVNIVESVSSFSWQEVIPYIDKVNPILLDKLETVLSELVDISEEPVDLSEYRQRFSAFKNLHPNTISIELSNEGVKLGTPIEKLIDASHNYIIALDQHPVTLSTEILGLVLLSNTSNDSVVEVSKSLLEDYSRDINVNTKAFVVLLGLLKKIEANQ